MSNISYTPKIFRLDGFLEEFCSLTSEQLFTRFFAAKETIGKISNQFDEDSLEVICLDTSRSYVWNDRRPNYFRNYLACTFDLRTYVRSGGNPNFIAFFDPAKNEEYSKYDSLLTSAIETAKSSMGVRVPTLVLKSPGETLLMGIFLSTLIGEWAATVDKPFSNIYVKNTVNHASNQCLFVPLTLSIPEDITNTRTNALYHPVNLPIPQRFISLLEPEPVESTVYPSFNVQSSKDLFDILDAWTPETNNTLRGLFLLDAKDLANVRKHSIVTQMKELPFPIAFKVARAGAVVYELAVNGIVSRNEYLFANGKPMDSAKPFDFFATEVNRVDNIFHYSNIELSEEISFTPDWLTTNSVPRYLRWQHRSLRPHVLNAILEDNSLPVSSIEMSHLRENLCYKAQSYAKIREAYTNQLEGDLNLTDEDIANSKFGPYYKLLQTKASRLAIRKYINNGIVNIDILNNQPQALYLLLKMNVSLRRLNKKRKDLLDGLTFNSGKVPSWLLTKLTTPLENNSKFAADLDKCCFLMNSLRRQNWNENMWLAPILKEPKIFSDLSLDALYRLVHTWLTWKPAGNLSVLGNVKYDKETDKASLVANQSASDRTTEFFKYAKPLRSFNAEEDRIATPRDIQVDYHTPSMEADPYDWKLYCLAYREWISIFYQAGNENIAYRSDAFTFMVFSYTAFTNTYLLDSLANLTRFYNQCIYWYKSAPLYLKENRLTINESPIANVEQMLQSMMRAENFYYSSTGLFGTYTNIGTDANREFNFEGRYGVGYFYCNNHLPLSVGLSEAQVRYRLQRSNHNLANVEVTVPVLAGLSVNVTNRSTHVTSIVPRYDETSSQVYPKLFFTDDSNVVIYRGYKFTQMMNAKDLSAEGSKMHHCVGRMGYGAGCAANQHQILSVEKMYEDGDTIDRKERATLQLGISSTSASVSYRSHQLRSYSNSDPTSELTKAVNSFVSKLNEQDGLAILLVDCLFNKTNSLFNPHTIKASFKTTGKVKLSKLKLQPAQVVAPEPADNLPGDEIIVEI